MQPLCHNKNAVEGPALHNGSPREEPCQPFRVKHITIGRSLAHREDSCSWVNLSVEKGILVSQIEGSWSWTDGAVGKSVASLPEEPSLLPGSPVKQPVPPAPQKQHLSEDLHLSSGKGFNLYLNRNIKAAEPPVSIRKQGSSTLHTAHCTTGDVPAGHGCLAWPPLCTGSAGCHCCRGPAAHSRCSPRRRPGERGSSALSSSILL